APLKPEAREWDAAQAAFSPHSQECGPVEAAAPGGGVRRDRWPLRTRKSAAPLKLEGDRQVKNQQFHSPHSQECGPVEALKGNLCPESSAGSPHSQECGPVEAG